MLQTGLAENANPTSSASITPVPIPKMATETVEMETVKTAEMETVKTAETEMAKTAEMETVKTAEMETAKTAETTPKPAIPVVH